MGFRIALVDDHKMLVDMLGQNILKSKSIDSVKCYYSGIDFLKEYKEEKFDLVVLDLRMPVINGFEVVDKIKEDKVDIKIVIISGVEGDGTQSILEKKGINGLVTKYNHIEVIKSVINTVAEGENCFIDDFYEKSPKFTEKEIEIIKKIAQEKSSKEIGDELCISENTVKTHRKVIMKKLEAKNVATLIGYAYRNHFI